MNQNEKIDDFAKHIPFIKLLTNKNTAEAVCNVWIKMLKMSPWDTIDQAMFKEGYDNVSLISHVNSTVECALEVSRIINKHHGIEFDEQLIITFGLLHDVDKVISYVYDENNNLIKSEVAEKIQHGVFSAIMAYEEGFDINMLHLLLTHTSDSKFDPQIKEGILYGYVDLCDWDMLCRYGK